MALLLPFSVSKWLPWLERVQAGDTKDPAPIDKVAAWMKLESGGNIASVGRVGRPGGQYPYHVYEAGLMQTYFDTPSTVKYGVTSKQLRAKCNPIRFDSKGRVIGGTEMPTNLDDNDRILQARVALETFKEHRTYARRRLLANGAQLAEKSQDFWCWVKLGHALPALFDYLPDAKRSLGVFPTWAQFTRYVDSVPESQLKANSKKYAYDDTGTTFVGWSRFWRNCEAFAGYTGGFAGFELLAVLALIAAIAVALSRAGVV